MSKTEYGKALTASRLSDDAAVFLTRTGNWVTDINQAVVAMEPKAQAALSERGLAGEANNLITCAYLMDVERKGKIVRATYAREAIRASRPTIQPAFA